MKHTSIKILYHFFSFLSDKTNGFALFVKYKLALGALLLGISATSYGKETEPITIENTGNPDLAEQPTCYKPALPIEQPVKDTVALPVAQDDLDNSIFCYAGFVPRPSFIGGEMGMKNYITENLKYPQKAKKKGIEGTVYVRFVVTETGKVANIEVYKGVEKTLDDEAVRVVSAMPDWIPSKQNGEQVAVYYVLPIKFRLNK
jgi:TonB family protein